MFYNLKRLNNFLEKYNIYALIATQPESIKYFGYDAWFTSVRDWMLHPGGNESSGFNNLCFIPIGEKPIIIVPAFTISFYEGSYDNLIAYGPFTNMKDANLKIPKNPIAQKIAKKLGLEIFSNYPEALEHLVSRFNLEKTNIAIEYQGANNRLKEDINRIFGNCKLFDGSELIRLTRMLKTPAEIGIIKKVSKITETIFNKTIELIKPGVNFGYLEKTFRQLALENDSEYEHLVVIPYGLGMIDLKDFKFSAGMIMGFDAGIKYKKYISDTALTVFLGKYKKIDLELYKRLYSIINAGVDAIKPGIQVSQVYKSMKDVIIDNKIENVIFEGHGIGLTSKEYPIINNSIKYNFNNGFEEISADCIIRENMVINLELVCNYFSKNTFSIEKTFLVTEKSSSQIVAQERNNPIFL